MRVKQNIIYTLFLIIFFGCSSNKSNPGNTTNETLYNYLTSTILEREAFSPIKNKQLNINLKKEFAEHKTSFLQAKTDEDLYFEILKLSNLRRDSHLKMKPLFLKNYEKKVLPIKIGVVFDAKKPIFVIKQIANDYANQYPNLKVGDELVKIGGINIDEIIESTKAYIPSSTNNNHYFRLAKALSTNDFNLSRVIDYDQALFTFKTPQNSTYTYAFSYQKRDEVSFDKVEKYNGFDLVLKGNNLNTYLSKKDNVLILEWLDFESDLPDEVDTLMKWAYQNNKLGYNLIIDATESSGGSNSIYALRRLVSKCFSVTKGNLRISDITPKFIEKKTQGEIDIESEKYAKRAELDDGTNLRKWLNNQVKDSCLNKAEYSNNVVFKMKYKTQNDSICPFNTHFNGKIVALFSPRGGSQLDQFASMIVDNKLAHTIGMSAGGYSNTWEWKELVKNPNTNNVLCEFMWNIGHTIRVNGEILEGNPAQVDEYFPPTKENFRNYKNILFHKSLEYFRTK